MAQSTERTMISEKSKEFLGEKVRFDDERGIIVGLAEIPDYSPYNYGEDRVSMNCEIDKSVMFVVSLESGETVIVAPCRVVTSSYDRDWVIKSDRNKILDDLRRYQKREANKIKSVGTALRAKFLKYPEYDRFIKNLENLKLEEVLWEKL